MEKLQSLRKRTFRGYDLRVRQLEVRDMRFEGCEFDQCFAGVDAVAADLRARQRFSRMTFTGCTVRESTITAAIVEDVLVDGLRVIRELRCEACAFRHVVLRGAVKGMVWIIPQLMVSSDWSQDSRALIDANVRYYGSADWAIDIAGAEFTDIVIQGIPSRLVRRDHETQAVAKKATILANTQWREDPAVPLEIRYALARVAREEFEEGLVIAPKASKEFTAMAQAIKNLRNAGVLEKE